VRFFAFIAVSLLAACGGVNINDRSVFRPPAHAPPAETVEQLSRWPIAELRTSIPDAEARHGFVGSGATRMAYTYVTRPGANRPVIFYCSGNGSDRFTSGVVFAQKTLRWGDVVMIDYPGYGDSPGEPSAAALERAAPSLSALATDLSRGRTLVFWGHSLGGFVCSRLVRETPGADGVILEATARNALEIGRAWRPWFAPFIRLSVDESLANFDVADALRDYRGPILLLGARRDRTLPIRLSRSLNEALRTNGASVTYVEVPQAQHVDIAWQPEFPAAASSFFASVAGRP
jgi:pimeloyl-ACP methyl ester carboxylesterase